MGHDRRQQGTKSHWLWNPATSIHWYGMIRTEWEDWEDTSILMPQSHSWILMCASQNPRPITTACTSIYWSVHTFFTRSPPTHEVSWVYRLPLSNPETCNPRPTAMVPQKVVWAVQQGMGSIESIGEITWYERQGPFQGPKVQTNNRWSMVVSIKITRT